MEWNSGFLLFRSGLDSAEDAAQEKQRKTIRRVEEVTESLSAARQRAGSLASTATLWSELLGRLTATDRAEKQDDVSWLEHFASMLGQEIPNAPAAFSDPSTSFQEVIIAVSQQVALLQKKSQMAANSATRAEKAVERKTKAVEKHSAILKRKLDLAFNPQSDEAQNAVTANKQLGFRG